MILLRVKTDLSNGIFILLSHRPVFCPFRLIVYIIFFLQGKLKFNPVFWVLNAIFFKKRFFSKLLSKNRGYENYFHLDNLSKIFFDFR